MLEDGYEKLDYEAGCEWGYAWTSDSALLVKSCVAKGLYSVSQWSHSYLGVMTYVRWCNDIIAEVAS